MAHNYSVAGHVHMSTSTNLSFVLSFNYIKDWYTAEYQCIAFKEGGFISTSYIRIYTRTKLL